MKKLLFSLVFLGWATATWSQHQLPKSAAPLQQGFSPERLQVLDEGIPRMLEERGTPGAAAMVIRKGKVVCEKAFGYQNRDKDIPMSKNSIFRIYSMTKPITSVAVMMLWEKGYFKLEDPIFLYLPELEHLKVGIDNANGDEIERLVSPENPITIQDLLRHTSGMTYGRSSVPSAVRNKWREAQLYAAGSS